MTVGMFITLLTAFAAATGLIVEAVKKILDEKKIEFSSNILACIVGAIVGIGGTACYYAIAAIPFDNVVNVISMILMGLASSVGAMVGYDKIIQMIGEVKGE